MTRRSTSRRSYLAAVGGAALTGGCLGGTGTSTVRMGVVPDVDPDTAVQQNTGLAEYLESHLDATVDVDTSADYAGMVRAMAAEQVDLAYFGGVSYILARHRADAEPVVVGSEGGSTEWHSAFVAHADGPSSMEDVVAAPGDYDLVFGDPISTSGTVMPTYYLRTEFDTRPDDFASTTHVGAHDATAGAIANASGDVGALNARIYDALVESGDVGDDVVELWRTPGFPDYPWAVAPTVDSDRVGRIREAFMKLDDRDRTGILDTQNVDEYVPVSHDDFTSLNEGVEMAGLLDGDESGANP
ncbi:phosphate/phosphite/phosphonate ABC transporter substrate-binding protein [Halostella litorea]|uniref:phosphate/phosphite/phosphonate ABC transporter substrate-binding protein n=1 Tax=Halostella litorea TaxID=2528831 RepID=UPI00109328E1|nr:phosphate/phosphite/phosphonate ABC transporter substrate-binding protein [Halostella litorea]